MRQIQGPNGPRQVEAVQGLVGAQEGLLDHVVGHVVAAHDAEGRAVDPPLVALHDLLEGKEVPLPCLGQEVGLGGVRRRRAGRSPGLQGAASRPIGKARPSPSTIRPGGRPYSGRERRKGCGRGRPRPERLLEDLDDDPAVLGPVVLRLVVHDRLGSRRRR